MRIVPFDPRFQASWFTFSCDSWRVLCFTVFFFFVFFCFFLRHVLVQEFSRALGETFLPPFIFNVDGRSVVFDKNSWAYFVSLLQDPNGSISLSCSG